MEGAGTVAVVIVDAIFAAHGKLSAGAGAVFVNATTDGCANFTV